MLYECSCGYSATTATAFYKHLSNYKDASGTHQLVQTRAAQQADTAPAAVGRSAWQGLQTGAKPAAEQWDAATSAAAAARRGWDIDQANPMYSGEPQPPSPGPAGPRRSRSPSFGSKLLNKLRGKDSPASSPGPAGTQGMPAQLGPPPVRSHPTATHSDDGRGAAPVPMPPPRHSVTAPVSSEVPGHAGTHTQAVRQVQGHVGTHTQAVPASPGSAVLPAQAQARAAAPEAGGGVQVEEIHLDLRARPPLPASSSGLTSILRVMGAGLAPFKSWTPAELRGELLGGPFGEGLGEGLWQLSPQAHGAVGPASGGFGPGVWPGMASGGLQGMSSGAASPAGEHTGEKGAMGPLRAVAAVEALLLWHNPWATARVLGGGLYTIVCVRHLSAGRLPVAPSTLLLGAALLLLSVNLVRLTVWRVRHHRSHGHHHHLGAGGSSGGSVQASPAASPKESAGPGPVTPARGAALLQSSSSTMGGPPGVSAHVQHAMDEEARVYQVAHAVLARAACMLVPALAAGAALAYRALSGRRLASSALTAGCLWLGMLLGELRLLGTAWFAAALWAALFTVPCAYLRSRAATDHLVEDTLRMAARLLVQSERSTLAIAASCSLALLVWAPAALIARATTALAVGFGVLLYPHVAAAMQQRSAARAAAGGVSNVQEGLPAGRISEGDGAAGEKLAGPAAAGQLPPLPLSTHGSGGGAALVAHGPPAGAQAGAGAGAVAVH